MPHAVLLWAGSGGRPVEFSAPGPDLNGPVDNRGTRRIRLYRRDPIIPRSLAFVAFPRPNDLAISSLQVEAKLPVRGHLENKLSS